MVCHAGVNCEDKILHVHEMLNVARATYSFLTDKSDVWLTHDKDCFADILQATGEYMAPSNQWIWLWVVITHQIWITIYQRECEKL